MDISNLLNRESATSRYENQLRHKCYLKRHLNVTENASRN